MNLNTSWCALYYPAQLRQYFRVASPNLATPLFVSTSGLGDHLEIVFAMQGSVIDEAAADRIAGAFAYSLGSFVQSPALNQENENA